MFPVKIREHSAGFEPGRGREKVLRGAKNWGRAIRGGSLRSE